MKHCIRASALIGFEDLVRSHLGNPVEILKQSGVLSSQLRDPNALISYSSCAKAMELAAQLCRCPILGIKLGELQGNKALEDISTYMSLQKTITESIAVAQRYAYLHCDAISVELEHLSDDLCRLVYRANMEEYAIFTQKPQLGITILFRLLSDLVGDDWFAHRITFKQEIDRQNKDIIERLFKCTIECGSDLNAIYFPSRFLTQQPKRYEAAVDKMVFEHLLQKPTSPKDLIAQASLTIKTLLPTGDCNKENVAMCLNLHAKKFERDLKAMNVTFRELSDQIRKREALRMLQENNMSLSTIALNLGYAELSVFSRRFKAWFGVSPNQWSDISIDYDQYN